MTTADAAVIVATILAIGLLVPQAVRLLRTHDVMAVSGRVDGSRYSYRPSARERETVDTSSNIGCRCITRDQPTSPPRTWRRAP